MRFDLKNVHRLWGAKAASCFYLGFIPDSKKTRYIGLYRPKNHFLYCLKHRKKVPNLEPTLVFGKHTLF